MSIKPVIYLYLPNWILCFSFVKWMFAQFFAQFQSKLKQINMFLSFLGFMGLLIWHSSILDGQLRLLVLSAGLSAFGVLTVWTADASVPNKRHKIPKTISKSQTNFLESYHESFNGVVVCSCDLSRCIVVIKLDLDCLKGVLSDMAVAIKHVSFYCKSSVLSLCHIVLFNDVNAVNNQ